MKQAKLIKAVLFDKDGTIMDSERINCEAYVAAAKKFGQVFTAKMFQSFIGVPTLDCYQMLATRYGDQFPLQDFIIEVQQLIEVQKIAGFPLKRGFADYFAYLKTKAIPMAVVTSASSQSAVESLRPLNLLDDFSFIVAVDDVKSPKPSPQCYQFACDRLNIQPQSALVFEDSNIGIEASLSAGCITIAIPDTQAIEPRLAKRCFRVIESFEDAYCFV